MSLTIVKFGGSLLGSPALDGMLAVAARAGVVVVPGGGRFADAVRDAQATLGFGDRAAHAMAILAMEQAALALADRRPDLVACATPGDFRAAARAGRPAIWLPFAMASKADVPASWTVTSDSLALWLGIELGAARVVLLKAAATGDESGPAELAAAGLVDPYLPGLAARFGGELRCVGPATAAALDVALSAPADSSRTERRAS